MFWFFLRWYVGQHYVLLLLSNIGEREKTRACVVKLAKTISSFHFHTNNLQKIMVNAGSKVIYVIVFHSV